MNLPSSISLPFIDEPPLIDLPSNYDRRQNFNAFLNYRLASNAGPRLLGIYPLENLNLNVQIHAGSGFPYTRAVESFHIDVNRSVPPAGPFNGARMPGYNRVDVQISRTFPFGVNRSSANLFLLIQNLFDRTNINQVWPFTGRYDTDGFLDSEIGKRYVANAGPNAEVLYQHRNRIPSWAGIPRLIRLGLRLDF